MRFLILSCLLAVVSARGVDLAKETSPERFKVADQAFRDRADEVFARRALEGYRAAYAAKPNDVEAAWRLSMAAQFVGMRLTKDNDEKKKLFAEGRDAALAAIEIDPGCAACHFWCGINMALYGDAAGVFKMLFSLGDVREHLKKTTELDPGYAYGGAFRVLGKIEERLPGILGGSNARAKEDYEKAIASAPDEPLNYLFLAKLLKDELDDTAGAVEVARKGMVVPLPQPDRLESREAYFELRRFFDGLPGDAKRTPPRDLAAH